MRRVNDEDSLINLSCSIRFLSFSHPYRSLSLPIVVRPGLRPSAPRTGRDGKGMRRGNEDGRYGWKVIEPLASLVAHFGSLLVTLIPFSSPPCRVSTPLPPTRPEGHDTARQDKGKMWRRYDPSRVPSHRSLAHAGLCRSIGLSFTRHSLPNGAKEPGFFHLFSLFFLLFSLLKIRDLW